VTLEREAHSVGPVENPGNLDGVVALVEGGVNGFKGWRAYRYLEDACLLRAAVHHLDDVGRAGHLDAVALPQEGVERDRREVDGQELAEAAGVEERDEKRERTAALRGDTAQLDNRFTGKAESRTHLF
jgi:hypothetical protein